MTDSSEASHHFKGVGVPASLVRALPDNPVAPTSEEREPQLDPQEVYHAVYHFPVIRFIAEPIIEKAQYAQYYDGRTWHRYGGQ